MTSRTKPAGAFCILALFAGGVVSAQTTGAKTADKAAAYYHFAMGHMYAEQAATYGNRGDYLSKAIDHYKQAIKADPSATFLSEELSDLYIQSGRIREAVLEYEDTVRQNPDDIMARRILGRIYARMIGDSQQGRINQDMLKKALDQYQKVSTMDSKDVDTWLMLGRLYKISENSVDSEKAYKKALELDEDNEDALTGLAMVYSDLGDNKRATEVLGKVAQKNPSMRTLTALASTYEQMRDYKSAAETLRKALELSPGNADLKRALAQDLMFSDQLDQALKLYSELAVEDPKDYQSYLRMSQIYRQKRDFAKAHEASDKAKEIEPNNLEIRFNEVNLLEAEGKVPEAIATLRSLLDATAKRTYSLPEKSNRAALLERLGIMCRSADKVDDSVAAFRQMADLDASFAPKASAQIIETYRGARQYPKAEEEAKTSKAAYPNDRMLTAVRASLLADVGKTDQAISELKSLLDGKADREIYLSLAQAYEKAKKYDEMAKSIDAAEKLSESDEEKETVFFTRGAMYERQKKYDLAESEFRKVLKINPDNTSALNYLGYMFADRNVKIPEAYQMISKAVEKEPNNGAYLDSLGWVYFRMGKLKEAEDYVRRSLEKVGRDPTVHDHLGDILFQAGKVKEAIAQWEAAMKDYNSGAAPDTDPAEIAKISKKLENARVRLAKETSPAPPKN
jgi:tetratricopeptide (TPR) repeat protein